MLSRNFIFSLVLTVGLAAVAPAAGSNVIPTTGPKRLKVVIDTEPGLDDAVAIVTALGRTDVEVLGITCPNGNTDTEKAAKNALRVLSVAGRLDIPVFKGSMLPLLGTFQYNGTNDYFGNDGLGDADSSNECIDTSLIRPEHGAVAMVNFVNKYPGEVVVIALGPLTNIALALRLDSTFADKVKELHIMGGSPTALGNMGPVSEFNFAWDPEAALVVLQEMHCPMYVTTWDLCIKNFLTKGQRDGLFSGDSNIAKFLRKIHHIKHSSLSQDTFSICDSICLAHALNRAVATDLYETYSTVELCGKHARGQMIADRSNIYGLQSNVRILQEINLDEVMAMIRQGVLAH